jgi:DNA repair protein RecO (recombination protein O)
VIAWEDEGLILSTRRHGESDAILEALTAAHGRRLGVVRGGGGRRRALLQPGATARLEWRARLPEHLGTFRAETARDRAGRIMADADALAALASMAALLGLLPEREPQPALYAASVVLVEALADGSDWPPAYALWELGFLREAGFGLDLASCAATGAAHDLIWVSPRSGRAVSRAAGAPYADRLLPLPGFLCGQGPADREAVADALRLTGWFIAHRLARAFGLEAPPAARTRLAARLGGVTPARPA